MLQFFFLCDKPVNLQIFFGHSQLHRVEAAPWDLVMQTRKGNVAGATSGASSDAATSRSTSTSTVASGTATTGAAYLLSLL